MGYDAIILAGDSKKPFTDEGNGTIPEALIDINGKPMVEYVIEALRSSAAIEQIYVVGPFAELTSALQEHHVTVIAGGESVFENIKIALETVQPRGKVLIATCDIPLLTASAVNDFLKQCQQTEADLYYPIVSRAANERVYPGVKRTYIRLREGVFTGGNLILFKPEILTRCAAMAEKAIALRKDPWGLVKLLGFRFVCRYFFGRLTIPMIEKRVGEILQIKGKGIISDYPEVGIDVDKPSDLNLVRQIHLNN